MSVTTVGDVHVIDLGDRDNRLTDDVLDEFHRLLDELEAGVGTRALVTSQHLTAAEALAEHRRTHEQ